MNQEFFKDIIGKQVAVDYKLGTKSSFINGEVLKVEDEFVTIANEDAMVSVLYSSIISVRIMTNGGKK